MGHVTIQNQALTSDQVFTVFQSGLAGRYEVQRSALPAVDFIVRKSALVGVGVKLQKKGDEARLRCAPMTPSTPLRMLTLNGLLPSLFMWPLLKRTTQEVETFAASAVGLGGDGVPAAAAPEPGASAPGEPAAHPAFAAVWIGLTALLLPTVVGVLFGYLRLAVNGPIVIQAIATGALAYFAPRFISAPVLRNPIVAGAAAWVASSLVLSLFSWGIGNELRTWFSLHGLAEFALLGASLFFLGRVSRGGARGAAPAPAAS